MGNYPIYDATFTLYRVSPLYHGKSPLLGNLDLHARRLRDNLKGDNFQSARLADGSTFGSSQGSLKSCAWELLGDEASWERNKRLGTDEEDEISMVGDVAGHEARGVHVKVEFETTQHDALLLGNAARISAVPGFTALPLLLIRMPVAIRESLIQYLSTAFDARISPMILRTGFLMSTLELLLDRNASPRFSDSGALNKGLRLQLAFPSVTPSLKSLDISMSKSDTKHFVSRGKGLWQLYQQELVKMSALSKPQQPLQQLLRGPFSAALSAYLNHHLTLTLDNPAVVLSKVVYGPFALSGEGKVKIHGGSEEAVAFWESLVEEAESKGLAAKVNDDTVLQPGKIVKQHVVDAAPLRTRIPTEPPPPYELHDPAALGR